MPSQLYSRRPPTRSFRRIVPALALLHVLVLTSCTTLHNEGRKNLPTAESSLKIARSKALSSGKKAAYYLQAASLALPAMDETKEGQRALALYNDATAELTDLLRDMDSGKRWNKPSTFQTATNQYRLTYDDSAKNGHWDPSRFTDFIPAKKLKRGNVKRTIIEPGVGGTLVGLSRKAGTLAENHDSFEPKRGQVAPVTAILDFKGANALLTLYDPAVQNTALINGETLPLGANLTAPLLFYPKKGPIRLLVDGLLGMMHVEKYLAETGLYMVQPYNPDRIPVILVHGLASTPNIWINVINEVEADPALRGHFQFWLFRYATGNPSAYSALRCREELAKIAKIYPQSDEIVMVGHSMGGLLSRMQATTTGRVLWDANLGTSADEIYNTTPSDSLVKRALIFDANPDVKRLIFICVPHRGSELATGPIGALAIRLISLPSSLMNVFTDTLGDTLQGANGKTSIPNSITSLDPNNPTLKAMDTLPIQATHNTIFGDRGKGNTPDSSDGVVPYWSSHLDSAESELAVPGPHGSYNLPQSIDEMKRILILQLQQSPHKSR